MANIVSRLSVHQEHELLVKLETAGLTGQLAQRVIESRGNILAKEIVALIRGPQCYSITVDYGQTVEQLVRVGRYDWANESIIGRNFPSMETGKTPIDILLLKFEKGSCEDAIRQMDEQGLRPATILELLALGAACPDLQRVHPIVALGSTWCSGDKIYAPCLRGDSSFRDLRLFWFEGWTPDGLFAAVRK